MEVKIDEINGKLTINGNTHEFLIGDDGDVVSEWVKSPNKNEENGKMLVAELLYIANVRQGNKQIERATNIRELAEFIKQNLNPKMMAGSKTEGSKKYKMLLLIGSDINENDYKTLENIAETKEEKKFGVFLIDAVRRLKGDKLEDRGYIIAGTESNIKKCLNTLFSDKEWTNDTFENNAVEVKSGFENGEEIYEVSIDSVIRDLSLANVQSIEKAYFDKENREYAENVIMIASFSQQFSLYGEKNDLLEIIASAIGEDKANKFLDENAKITRKRVFKTKYEDGGMFMAGGNIKVGDKFKDGETTHIVTKIEDVDYYDPYEKQRIVGKDVEIESYNNGKKGGTSYTSLEDAEQMLSRFEKINEDGGTFMTGGFLTGVAVGVAGKWAYDKYGNKVKSKFEDGGDISGEEFNYEIGGL